MKTLSILLAVVFLCVLTATADACPTCKLALRDGVDYSQQGYAYSILFMLAMPIMIALGWAIFIFKSVMSARLPNDQTPDDQLPTNR